MNKLLNRVISIIITFIIVFSLVVPVNAATTVKNKEEAAKFLEQKGLLQGDEKGDLMLDKVLTREQMIVIVSRLLGKESEAIDYSLKDMTFKDVPESSDYAPYIAWAKDNKITQGYNDEKFGFGDYLTTWQTKAFLLRSLGYKKIEDKSITAKSKQLRISLGSKAADKDFIKRSDMALLMYNTLNAKSIDGKILIDILRDLQLANQAQPLEMEAQIINDSSIKIKFNRSVLDTKKIVFELKGKSIINTTSTWDNTKTEAILKCEIPMTDGIYTIKGLGEKFAVGKDIMTILMAENVIPRIEIIDNKLYKAVDYEVSRKGIIKFKIIDSLGIDVTRTINKSDINISCSKQLNNFDIDSKTGIINLYFSSTFTNNETSININITSSKHNIIFSQQVFVEDSPRIDTINLKSIEYPSLTTKLLTQKNLAGYIIIEARDKNGNIINEVENLKSDIVFVKNDNGLIIIPENYTNNFGEKCLRLKIDTTGILLDKSVILTATSNVSKKTSSIILDIKEINRINRIVLGLQTKEVFENDANESLIIPFRAFDQYNNELSRDEIVTNINNINIIADSLLNGKIAIGNAGSNKGKIINIDKLPLKGTYNINVNVIKGNVETYVLQIK